MVLNIVGSYLFVVGIVDERRVLELELSLGSDLAPMMQHGVTLSGTVSTGTPTQKVCSNSDVPRLACRVAGAKYR